MKLLYPFLLLIAICVWVILPESGAKKELKDSRKALLQSRDSIRTLSKMQEDSTIKYQKQVERIQAEVRIAEHERDIATRQTQIAWRKYEEVQHRNYSAPQLDSIIGILYPH